MGAWIETSEIEENDAKDIVAPYVGAWIETTQITRKNTARPSHPTWVRGLKHHNQYL